MYLIIFIIFLIIFFLYIIYVLFLRSKLDIIENNLQKNFKIRNSKVASLFYITQKYLNKHDEVFKEFIILRKKDFNETSLNFYFENKIDTYKKLHKELDFIFKVCEKNDILKRDPKYNYIKDEILKKWEEIWKEYNLYKPELENYKKFHKFSKYMILWLFIR